MNREISFYQYLTPEEQELLDRSMQQVPCRKSQVVHRHGDSCVGLIFVRKGRLAFSILSEEGREITVFRIEKGESCILSAACVLQSLEFESHITAEVNSEIAILPAPTLSQLMNSNPDVERLVYKQAVIQYSGVLRTMQQIIFLSLEKRLATFLLEESQRRQSPSFSATHEQIDRPADRAYLGFGRGLTWDFRTHPGPTGRTSVCSAIETPGNLLFLMQSQDRPSPWSPLWRGQPPTWFIKLLS